MQTLPVGARQIAAQQRPACVISTAGPTIPPRKAVAPLDRCNLPNRGNRRTDKRIRVSAPDFLLQAGSVIGDRVRMDGKKLGNPSSRRADRRDLGCSLKHRPGRAIASAILRLPQSPEKPGIETGRASCREKVWPY